MREQERIGKTASREILLVSFALQKKRLACKKLLYGFSFPTAAMSPPPSRAEGFVASTCDGPVSK